MTSKHSFLNIALLLSRVALLENREIKASISLLEEKSSTTWEKQLLERLSTLVSSLFINIYLGKEHTTIKL